MSDELTRSKFTFWTVLCAFGILLIAFLVTINVFKNEQNPAESITAVLGTITGVLGTLTGYVAGQAGKDAAENRAAKAQQLLTEVVDATDRGVLDQVRRARPELFS